MSPYKRRTTIWTISPTLHNMKKDYENLEDKLDEIFDRRRVDHNLSEDEVKVLREVMRVYRMFLSWGKLGKLVIWLVITVAAIFTALNQMGVGIR